MRDGPTSKVNAMSVRKIAITRAEVDKSLYESNRRYGTGRQSIASTLRKVFLGTTVVVSLLTAVFPAFASSKAVVKPSQIPGIVKRDYAVNNEANATLSYSLQASHEQGTSLAMDDAAFRADRLSGYPTLDGARYYPFTGSIVSTSLPFQTSHPAQFAVLMRTVAPGTLSACRGTGGLLVEQKDTAKSNWRVTLEPNVPVVTAVPNFDVGSSVYGHFVSLGKAPALTNLSSKLIAGLYSRARTGVGGPLLPASAFARGCTRLEMQDPHTDVGTTNGLTSSFTASTLAPSDLVIYATKGSGALVMFTVRENVSYRPSVAGDYVVWPHHTTIGSAIFNLLPAGHYGTVTWAIDQQVAIAVPSTTSSANARIVGSYSSTVSISGTPAA
jgi:hypothetical protein